MKHGQWHILIWGLAVLLVSLACGINIDLTPPPPTVIAPGTFVAQTFAALTQSGAGATPLPTATADATFTPVQVQDTSTPQPTTVTTDALCYAGPGETYEVVSNIKAGTQVKLLGRGAQAGWWVLENPVYKDPCWIMQQFVSIDPSIDTSNLLVYAVPPTPTPKANFLIQYQYLSLCNGWDPVLSVTNTSGTTFRSYDAYVVDSAANSKYERTANGFDKPLGCSFSQSISQLGPGQQGWVHVFGFPYNLVGKKLDATVSLCTDVNLGGHCITKSLRFTP